MNEPDELASNRRITPRRASDRPDSMDRDPKRRPCSACRLREEHDVCRRRRSAGRESVPVVCEPGDERRQGEELVSPLPGRLQRLLTADLQDGHRLASSTAISVIREVGAESVSPASVSWAWIGPKEISIANRSRWALSLSTASSQAEEPSSCIFRLLLAGQKMRMTIARQDRLLVIRRAATPFRRGTRIRLVRAPQ